MRTHRNAQRALVAVFAVVSPLLASMGISGSAALAATNLLSNGTFEGSGVGLGERVGRKQRVVVDRGRQRWRPRGAADRDQGRIEHLRVHDDEACHQGGRGHRLHPRRPGGERACGPVGVPRDQRGEGGYLDIGWQRQVVSDRDLRMAERPDGRLHGQDFGRLAHCERVGEPGGLGCRVCLRQPRPGAGLGRRLGRHAGSDRPPERLGDREQRDVGDRVVVTLDGQRRRRRLRRLPGRHQGRDRRRQRHVLHRYDRAREHPVLLHRGRV